jgi:gliding motility-associated-like protein
MDATLGFGVPPYTVSHPWSANGRDTVVGSYGACISEGTVLMNLKIPGADCPFKCLSPDTTIVVPAPTVVDACGDTVKNIPAQKVKLKPVPVISYVPIDTSVCTGSPVVVSLRSCVPGTTFNWTGSDNASGSGDTNISDNTHDSSNSPLVVTYKILGTANGCNSDTITAQGVINPYPIVNITQSDTMNIGESKKLSATGGGTYIWAPSTGLNCTTCPNPVATPTITTTYYVTVTDSEGCAVSKSVTLIVLDENITIPNVITPDDAGPMGLDNLFYIRNLQLYPNSKLVIYDRWGKQIYSSSNYQNDWNGGGQSDGVYYYLLTLANGKKYKGFFELIK